MRRLPILLVFLLTPSWASAHNVGVDCLRRLRHFEVEVYFDDDTAAQKAKVEVVNAGDEVVAHGLTDAKGRWNFRKPAPGIYEVRVDAGAGHRAKKKFDVPASTVPEALTGFLLDASMRIEETTPISTEGPTVSESSPARVEFTQTPWLKAVLGLVVIVCLSGAFLVASKLRKNGKTPLAA